MINSLKQTFINWFNENKKLAYILGGAIGVPLAVAIGLAAVALVGWVFVSIFGITIGITLIILMSIGAFVGYYIYSIGDND